MFFRSMELFRQRPIHFLEKGTVVGARNEARAHPNRKFHFRRLSQYLAMFPPVRAKEKARNARYGPTIQPE